MSKTNIEWTEYTLNPFVGCSKCSPACQNCFAERFAARLAKNPKMAAKYAGVVDGKGRWTGQISKLDLSCFDKLPKKPSRVFVGSMTDFFHENVPFDYQIKILDKIREFPQHTFLFLTKRIVVVRCKTINWNDFYMFPANAWLGVTICDQREADQKIPYLLNVPCVKRFISVEPMLSRIDIRQYLQGDNKLSWVIAGGETGPNARPMHEAWVKRLRDQCLETGTPFFFKSWGEWCPYNQLHTADKLAPRLDSFDKRILDSCSDKKDVTIRIGKKRSGHLIDGVEYKQFPEG